MKVYRLEHKTLRCGPWWIDQHNKFYDLDSNYIRKYWVMRNKLWKNIELKNDHPIPEDDFNGWVESDAKNLVFGCSSIDKIELWFGSVFDELHDLGYVINVYNVKTVMKGKSGNQVAFRRKNAKLINTISIKD